MYTIGVPGMVMSDITMHAGKDSAVDTNIFDQSSASWGILDPAVLSAPSRAAVCEQGTNDRKNTYSKTSVPGYVVPSSSSLISSFFPEHPYKEVIHLLVHHQGGDFDIVYNSYQ